MLAPYPQYQGGIGDTYDNIANSNYNSAQIVFRQRMSNGLQFMVGYGSAIVGSITCTYVNTAGL